MAGVPGLEPGPKVLETSMLTIDTIPLFESPPAWRHAGWQPVFRLFAFSVHRMAAASTAELFELKPVRRGLFVLGRDVVAFFALRTL